MLECFLLKLQGWRVCKDEQEKLWILGPLCMFWSIWKARNRIAFKDGVLSLQRLKASFVFSLWSKTKLSIKVVPLTLIDFIDWVGSQ